MASRVTDVYGESIIHGITSEMSRQGAGCKFVCSGSTSIKEAVFCIFDLAYFLCRFYPHDICCDEEDHKKGREQCIS